MTDNLPQIMAANQAAHALRGMPAELLELLKAGRADEQAARGWEPPREERGQWNDQRVREQRQTLTNDVRQHVTSQLDAIEQRASAAETAISEYTAGAGDRPDDAGADTRETRAWDRARAMLDAGVSPAEVIAGADVDGLRALRRELPAWLTVRHLQEEQRTGGGKLTASRSAVEQRLRDQEAKARPHLDAVTQRLAEVLPKPEGDRLRLALDAPHLLAGVRERVTGMRSDFRENGAGGGLRAVLAARMAERQAGARTGSGTPAA